MAMELSKFNQVGVPYEQRYTNDNAALSKFTDAFSGLDKQDNGVEDKSIFAEGNERQDLFKQIVEADAQDGVKGNIFAPDINLQLLGDYEKAMNGKKEDIDSFMNKLIMLEAKDGKFDGNVFRSDINNKQGKAVQDTTGNPIKQSLSEGLKKSTSMKNFAEMLLKFDLEDNGKYDGSIYTNKALMEYLDKVDNGKVDNSSQRFIENIINPAGAQTPNYDNMLAGYNLLNGSSGSRLDAIDKQIAVLRNSSAVQKNQVNPESYYGSIQNNPTDKTGPSTNATSASRTQVGNLTIDPAKGKKYSDAARAAQDGTKNHCYNNVANALDKFGINLSGMSAYMGADQLAKSGKAQEVTGLKSSDLPNLPAGAIVVWDRGNGHEHGHISIASGDGQEYSSKTRQQITNYGTSFRVFIPKDIIQGGQQVAA